MRSCSEEQRLRESMATMASFSTPSFSWRSSLPHFNPCSDRLSLTICVVPLPVIGMVAYGLVTVLGLQFTQKSLPFGLNQTDARLVLLSTTTSMAAASGYFLYLLSTKFSGSSCSYCLLSALLSFSLFFITLKDFGLPEIKKELGLQLFVAGLVIVTLNSSYSNSRSGPSSMDNINLPYFPTEITSESTPFAISLAKHLNSIGAKMYGAFWCSHCLEQKEMFGREAAKHLNYVECFPNGFKKGTLMEKSCAEVGIEGFPTWVINGKVLSGELEFSELAEASGFPLDKATQSPNLQFFKPNQYEPKFSLQKKKMCSQISESEQEQLLEKLEVFKIKGKDKQGRKILRIIGKFFPARILSVDVLRKYLEEKIFPRLGKRKFSVLYVHTGVQRSENFPGISALRSIYEAIPMNVKENLEAVYFVHPGLQSRLFLATFGRLLFTGGGLYGKLRYVSRLDYLWEQVRRNEIEIPEFVYDHDEDLEHRPMMDYGLESDHPRVYDVPAADSPVSMYSMRCIL
ncbi:hypothetical protein F8388_007721 [Cannabis sativa]|uniref:CRAL-TRIO domain-containing protein n=3 Tax=Cannabis sativa TaxID=3483 RepID=A0A7J6FT06_CANSA|nr:hypothetical protein F8388_007721 [Cannabis sativa]